MNRLDATLQVVCPTVMVPAYESLQPLVENGHRFLCAQDGLHAELRRPWLHTVFRVAESAVPLPYGIVEAQTALAFNQTQFVELLSRFVDEARRACPNEHAAWLSFGPSEGLRYEETEVISSGTGHIHYRRPSLTGSRTLAVDLHSHGRHSAFWSDDDDSDDVDDAKLAIVVGNLDRDETTFKARLAMLGAVTDLSEWLASIWHPEKVCK